MHDCVCLTLFVIENQHHDGQPVYQWLLRQASAIGLPGGTALRAMSGFGRHHVLHESHFYELAGELPMEVVFIASRQQIEALLAHVSHAGLSLFHYVVAAESATTGAG